LKPWLIIVRRVPVPPVAHFVFGLREQTEPFHVVHYLAIESCRRLLQPERIYLHHKHLPYGPYWDRIRPHLTLRPVDLVPEVEDAPRDELRVPQRYQYAHHADFVRLDALIETGGVYADIDTIFVRPFPADLFDHPFVLGREYAVHDELTGALRPSTCNALLMAEPGSAFARTWRAEMAGAMNGTWSNHTGFLAEELTRRMPDAVHVVGPETFFPFPPDTDGIAALLEDDMDTGEALSIHLWSHLWWERERQDFSAVSAADLTEDRLRASSSTYARLARPFLPDVAADLAEAIGTCTYLSLDEVSGYAEAATRCWWALAQAGVPVTWTGLVRDDADATYRLETPVVDADTVVAHVVPEYFPSVRSWFPNRLLVGHTVWETDRLPRHWPDLLEVPDLLVVPCQWNAEVIGAAGVTTPVAVVPHVAPLVRRVELEWEDLDPDAFVFTTIGQWTERKGVDLTVRAYLQAFTRHDPVVLVVKTSWLDCTYPGPLAGGHAGPGTSAYAVARLLAARGADAPAVLLVTREITEGEVAGLHTRANAYVSLCRSEGWGLGAFDAAAYGNPVVMTGYGGQLDYLDPAASWIVDHALVPVHAPGAAPSYTPDQHWAEPSLDHGAALMREVFDAGAAARARAAPLADTILTRYSPASVAAAFIAAVTDVSRA
jgi:glycosyltransferase involved in cell wall biosynthesis